MLTFKKKIYLMTPSICSIPLHSSWFWMEEQVLCEFPQRLLTHNTVSPQLTFQLSLPAVRGNALHFVICYSTIETPACISIPKWIFTHIIDPVSSRNPFRMAFSTWSPSKCASLQTFCSHSPHFNMLYNYYGQSAWDITFLAIRSF